MMMMPPPYYPPPPKRGRSFAGAIFTTLATTILGGSLILNAILLFSQASSAKEGYREETLVEGDSTQQIAVIPIHGVIDDEQVQRFEKMISAAEKNASVKAIVLDVDSPGGAVTSSDEMYARILQAKEKKKIVASITGLGASGAYYLSCAADYIVAEKTSLTGSIGVIMPSYNFHKLTDSYGIEETTIVADGGTFKNAGSPFKPETDQDRAYFKSILNQAFDTFKKIVTTNRKLKGDIGAIANGKIYTADEASGFGLIDQVGYPHDAWDKAAQLAGLTNKEIVRYEPSVSWLNALGDSKYTGGSPKSQGSVQINGININLDRNAITELLTPRPMYLWRGQ
jgi:protease-4